MTDTKLTGPAACGTLFSSSVPLKKIEDSPSASPVNFVTHLILIICFLFSFVSISLAQEDIRIKTRAWPAKVTLGDEIRFYIQIDRPANKTVRLPEKIEVAPFEVKNSRTLGARERGGRTRETILLTLTVFELGELKIPPVSLIANGTALLTQPVQVKVVSVGKRATDKDDIRPIKGPVSIDLGRIRDFLLGLLAAGLAAFLAAKVALRVRRQRLLDLESLKSPHERVFLELGRLRQKQFLEQNKPKEFYTEFADILRRYLERQFALEALEHTTPEILETFKTREPARADLERLKEILENSDLVKFAKFSPPRSLEQRLSESLVAFVESTKPPVVPAQKK